MDSLQAIFNETMKRESFDITIDNVTYKAFARKNDSGNKTEYITLYTHKATPLNQGDIYFVNSIPYLVLKSATTENEIYNKHTSIKCNQAIKYMLRKADDTSKADLNTLYAFGYELSPSLNIDDTVITRKSTYHVTMPLNNLTRRINNGERFYNEYYGQPFKIIDLNYQNGVVELYCERDLSSTNDDKINGVADRWLFEDKPKTYQVIIAESDINVENGATQTLTVSVKEDDVIMETTPTINWTSSNSGIATVDENNIVNALSVGSCVVTGSYKANENDISITDSVNVTVNENVVIGDIVVTPPYNSSTYYRILKGKTKEFTCSIDGLANPNWDIVIESATTTAYTNTIDNTLGKFTVVNNATTSSQIGDIYFKITETITGKTLTYKITLSISAF